MVAQDNELRAVFWQDGKVFILDQTYLPRRLQYLECDEAWQVAEAIRQMRIRGAPAIGVAAAFGVALAIWHMKARSLETVERELERATTTLLATRPTAINLRHGVEKMQQTIQRRLRRAKRSKAKVADLLSVLREEALAEANRIAEADVQANMTLAAHGAYLFPQQCNVLTYCNTGALATAGYGTALGVIRRAAEQGKEVHVYACETRPFLQGSRLTAYELCRLKIPATLITDNAAGLLMQRKQVDLVITGADRIVKNGDVANKIGTYALALLAHQHGIPFYVAAPSSTLDLVTKEGEAIPVEERSGDEVRFLGGVQIAPEEVEIFHPAFDVTPAKYITAIITEYGVAKPPFSSHFSRWAKRTS